MKVNGIQTTAVDSLVDDKIKKMKSSGGYTKASKDDLMSAL